MYKVIVDGHIVDLVENVQYIRFLPSGHIAFTDKTSAQGFIGSDGETIFDISLDNARLEDVSDKDVVKLKTMLESGIELTANVSELEKIKEAVIEKMASLCQQKITSGFDLVLSNGQTYWFTLTVEDQLNLRMIENQLNSDKQVFIYHAAELPCETFSKEDMIKIINKANSHIVFHTTYFNSLKYYIKELTDITKINEVVYGTDLSNYVANPVIKNILEEANL